MESKWLHVLLAAVVLIAITAKIGEAEKIDPNSALEHTWHPEDLEIGIDKFEDELNTRRKEQALKELKKILGIRGGVKKDTFTDVPPQFMIELYNTVTDIDGKTRENNPYNAKIVRSFTEIDSSSLHYYIFNVSNLEENESVLVAELHLYRKRSSPKSMPPSVLSSPYYLIRVYQVLEDKNLNDPDLHRLLNVHYVGAYSSGWQIFNVKQAVLSWLSGTPNLGLLVSATTIFGDSVSVDFSRRNNLPHDKQPILVLFNDVETNFQPKESEEQEHRIIKKNMKIEDNEYLDNKMMENDIKRSKRYTRMSGGQLEEVPDYILGNPSEKFYREKNSEIQDDTHDFNKIHDFVSRRKSSDHALTSMDIYQRVLLREKLNSHNLGTDTFRMLEERSRFRRDALSWTTATPATSTDECRKPQPEPCAKRDLYVNFRDIGLSTIIAPEGYAAYQCRGHCESPLSQEQKPTNHATIQGIIHKMNLASSQDVETPCCVPVNLSSISILYHDEERDGVVMKSYTDMAVVSCGCR